MAKQSQLVHIKENQQVPLSKAQKQFNSYLKKIEKLKNELQDTEELVRYLHQSVHEFLIPLEQQLIEKRVEWVRFFDEQASAQKLTAKEQEIVGELICNHTFQLIEQFGRDELKSIYEKYQGKSFDEVNDEQNQQTSELMKSLFGSMMGIDFEDEVDVSNPEKLQEYVQQKLSEQESNYEEQQRNRKKSKKQLEKEEKAATEAQQVTKSVREIYTKLVKEFHPDREQDDAEKIRKTEIMHRITAAYEKDDLMELLRLQLEFEHITQDNINELAQEQLKRYNKVLKEQVDTLQEEIYWLEGGDDPSAPFNRLGRPTTKWAANWAIDNEKARIQELITAFEEDLTDLLDSKAFKKSLKDYAKTQKQRMRQSRDVGSLLDLFDI